MVTRAERLLLSGWVAAARRHGLRQTPQVVAWVRRKAGGDITVVRQLHDGTLGCSVPCVLCARELRRFDMRVHCSLGGGEWFSGKLDQDDAPVPRPTTGQVRALFRPQRANQQRQRKVVSRKPADDQAATQPWHRWWSV